MSFSYSVNSLQSRDQGLTGFYGLMDDLRQVGFLFEMRLLRVRHAFGPNVKSSSPPGVDLPHSPNAFAFVVTVVEDIMLAKIPLGPMTPPVLDAVFASYDKSPNPVPAFAGKNTLSKGQLQIHLVLSSLDEISRPGPARKARVGLQGFRIG